MAHLSINNSLQNKSYNDSDTLHNYSYKGDIADIKDRADYIIHVLTCITICIGIPLTLMAIHGVYSLVRKDHVAPIFIINLLISDLIQFSCMIFDVTQKNELISSNFSRIYYLSLMVSVGFMVCISLERYLVIAQPLWYHVRWTIKISVMVCVVVWTLPFLLFIPMFVWYNLNAIRITFGVFLLLPLPFFIFFMSGTFKALSAARSVSLDEKRRIVAVLVLVTLIYGLLFFPTIICYLEKEGVSIDKMHHFFLSVSLIRLSPLADLFLYFFMKKGSVDKLLASLCFCNMDTDDISTATQSA